MIELFNKLMEVRDIAHQIHLTKSGTQAKHEALEDFYTPLLENTDLFIEVYQGQFGLIDNFGDFKSVEYEDHIKYFEEFAVYIDKQRDNIVEEATHLNAVIDDVLIDTYKLLYKLKNLT